MGLQKSGADSLIQVVATMLQTGYTMGRQLTEVEILEGWMRRDGFADYYNGII